MNTKKILMIVGSDTFRDEEYFVPKSILETAGYEITTASEKPIATSKIENKKVAVDILSQNIDLKNLNYDAVVYVGGPGAQVFFDDMHAHKIAWKMYENGKIVSAICIAPVILARSGLLTGKMSTVWEGAKAQLCEGECIYKQLPVVTDGRIITANGPEAAEKFAQTILEKLQLTKNE